MGRLVVSICPEELAVAASQLPCFDRSLRDVARGIAVAILMFVAAGFGSLAQALAGEAGPQPKFLRPISEGESLFVLCKSPNSRCGVVDETGALVLAQTHDNLAVGPREIGGPRQFGTWTATGWGIFDTTGRWLVAPKYASAQFMVNDRAAVTEGELWGYVDRTGKMVIDAKFDLVGDFHYGLANVRVAASKKYALIDRQGRYVVEPVYDFIAGFTEDRAAFIGPDLGGYFDLQGSKVLTNVVSAAPFSEGLGAVLVTVGTIGFVDRAGDFAFKAKFSSSGDFHEGLAYARTAAGKVGFVNRQGKTVIAAKFDDGRRFSEGMAAVSLNGKFGFTDRKGDWQIKPKFDTADYDGFRNGVAIVNVGAKIDSYGIAEGGRWGAIDTTGEWIIKPVFENLYHADGLILGWTNQQRTYFRPDGRIVATEG